MIIKLWLTIIEWFDVFLSINAERIILPFYAQ